MSVLRIALYGLFVLLLIGSVRAFGQVTLQASPTEIGNGGEARAAGSQAPAGNLMLELRAPNSLVLTRSAAFSADADGNFVAGIAIPANTSASPPSGATHSLHLVNADTGAALASTPMRITPSLSLRLPAERIDLGARFAFQAEGLSSGHVRLRLGNRVIAGPFPVSGPTFEGFALLPVDAASAGSSIQVQIDHLVGDQRIGYGEGRLLVANTSPDAVPRLIDVVRPPEPLRRIDAPFEISGRLSMPRQSLAGWQAQLFIRLSSGRMLPITQSQSQVAADGSFRVTGEISGLLRNGVHLPAGDIADEFLVFTEPSTAGNRGGKRYPFDLGSIDIGAPGSAPPDPRITVVVLDAAGNPLENAIVLFDAGRWNRALGDPDTASTTPAEATALAIAMKAHGDLPTSADSTGGLIDVTSSSTRFLFGNNQISNALGLNQATQCPLSLSRGITNSQGRFEALFEQFTLDLLSNVHAIGEAATSTNPGKGSIEHVPVQAEIEILVNALPAGHSFDPNPLVAKGGKYALLYREDLNSFFGWNADTNRYDILLGTFPTLTFRARSAYIGEAVYPLQLELANTPRASTKSYGPLTTFPDSQAYPTSMFSSVQNIFLRMSTNEALYGLIDWVKVEQLSETQQVVRTWDLNGGSVNCNSALSTQYVTFLTDIERLPHAPSGIPFRLRVKQQGVPETQAYVYPFRIRTRPSPPWFDTPGLEQHRIVWKPGEVTLSAQETRPVSTVSATPQGASTGPISNRSEATDRYSERLTPGNLSGLQRSTTSTNQAANRNAPPETLAGPASSMRAHWGPETIVDTGNLPLFRMVWGVPPIASATFGADARFWATLKIEASTLHDSETGAISASMTTTPAVGGNIRAFFDFSAIFGLVSMEASFSPDFRVAMPITVNNNRFEADLDTRCMVFSIRLRYEVNVGLCPICVGVEGSGNAFTPLREPSGCPTPAAPSLPTSASLAKASLDKGLGDYGINAIRRPSVSFDPFGQGSLADIDRNGQVTLRAWNGNTFGITQTLGLAVGADEIVHSHFAPGRAVMLYSASSLTQSQFLGSTFAAANASRRIVYRTRAQDGTWSLPVALATNPAATQGEAKPALAVCPMGQTGCPAGGEVYAVWMRGTTADPMALGTEVWGGRYRNGVWSNIQRLANPGNASDQLPRATYVNGTPVVSFVRMPQRGLGAGNASQRQLMLIRPGIDTAPQDIQAPSGVIWQDIGTDAQNRIVLTYTIAPYADAVIGNQSLLHAARGICDSTACTFTHTRQRDGFGRDIRAEAPRLARTTAGMRVAYRGLGYGPDSAGAQILPGDAPGTVAGTGEFMSLTPNFLPSTFSVPQAISGNGALHFQPQLFQHPISGALLGLSTSAGLAPITAQALEEKLPFALGKGIASTRQLDDSLAEFLLPDGADLVLLEASTEQPYVTQGETLRVRVLVESRGSAAGRDVILGASWNGEWDSGVPQSRHPLPQLESANSVLADIEIPVPTTPASRGPRVLHLTLDPLRREADAHRENNHIELLIGALPIPRDFSVMNAPNDRHALIQWAIDDDPRVIGYIVYRDFDEAGWQPIGNSETTGFVDMMTLPRTPYRYRIASYDEEGTQSAMSGTITVMPRIGDALFQDGFEAEADE